MCLVLIGALLSQSISYRLNNLLARSSASEKCLAQVVDGYCANKPSLAEGEVDFFYFCVDEWFDKTKSRFISSLFTFKDIND